MGLVETTADILSAVYILIMLIGIYHVTDKADESTKWYKYCCWTCFAGLLIDSMAYRIQDFTSVVLLITLVNYLSYVLFDLLMWEYSVYLSVYIGDKGGKYGRIFRRISLLLCLADAVYLTVGTVLELLFKVEAGAVVNGPWIRYVSYLPTLCLLACAVFTLSNVKRIQYTDTVILLTFAALHAVIDLLWFFNLVYISGYVGHAVSLTIIFVLIQFRVISETGMKADIFNRLSERDVLTGLKNRRGYREMLAAVSEDETVHAVFCDVNSLKVVNDTCGHDEGDKMIRKMAKLLTDIFSDEGTFRISGDEFVVIFRGGDEQAFSDRIRVLKQSIQDNGRIAAMGYDAGKGREVLQVIKNAEKKMYADKAAYYIESGRDRRGR